MFEKLKADIEGAREAKIESDLAMLYMLGDLRYPVSQDGSVLDMTYFGPLITWHLIRCGWRNDPEKRIIKPRKVTAKGVIKGAVEWVSVNEPDDPLADLPSMTMQDVQQLPPRLRAEALRRMGGPETPELPENPGWTVATSMRIQDAPDTTNDGRRWTGRKGVSQ